MKFVDLLGREIKVNDIVANATSCTSHGYLRRSIVKRVYNRTSYTWGYVGLEIKSLTIGDKWGWKDGKYQKIAKSVSTGNTGRGTTYDIKTQQLPEVVELDVIRLGTLEEAFTPEELQILKSSNTKLNYE